MTLIVLAVLATSVVAVVQLTECQVAGYLRQHGFPEVDVPKLVCASFYESSRECSAKGPPNFDGSVDYGILQVNSRYWCSGGPLSGQNGCGVSCQAIISSCDAGFACAKIVYDAQGTHAWYGYTGHRSTCDAYRLPSSCANGGGGGPVAPPSGPTQCQFQGVQGVCSVQSDCQASGKLWTSSNSGATGCESEASDVRCCTNPGSGGNSNGGNSNSGGNSNGDPPCTYRGHSGTCVSSCSGGQFRSSRQGANGCQAYANNIKCCISSSNLVDDIYNSYQSSSAPTGLPIGVIVGIVIAAVVVLAIVISIAVYVFVFHGRRQNNEIAYSNPAFSDVATPTLK